MKNKFFAVAAFAFAFAIALSANAYTAADFGSTTLKRGSRGMYVSAMQTALNTCTGSTLVVDGNFGSGTKAAVMAFQASKPLKADGIVGMNTKAALAACGTTTTPTTPTTPVVVSGTEGYVTDIASDSANRVSTVYESDTNKIVAGFRMTARLADQKLETVKVTLKNVDTSVAGSSASLNQYATSVSLMKDGAVVKTMTIAEADRSTTDDTFTFQFTGIGATIAKDTIGRFSVAINANGGIDSTYAANADWIANIKEVRTTSPNGVYKVDDLGTNTNVNGALIAASAGNYDAYQGTKFSFGKFSSTGVKAEVALANSNPSSQTIAVSESTETKDQKLTVFKITAKNSDLTLRKLPVKLTSSATLSNVVNTVKLMKGSDTTPVDTIDASSCVAGLCSFANISTAANTISAGTSAEFAIVVDLKKQKNGATAIYPVGTTLKAEILSTDIAASATFSIIDKNGDQLANGSTYRTGSANGETHTLVVDGVTVSVSSKSATAEDISNTALKARIVASFNTTLTSTSGTVYIPAGAANAIVVNLRNANTGTTVAANTGATTLIKSDSDTVKSLAAVGAMPAGNYYEISGSEGFVFGLSDKTVANGGNITTAGTYAVELASVKVYTTDGTLVTIPVTGQLTNTVALN